MADFNKYTMLEEAVVTVSGYQRVSDLLKHLSADLAMKCHDTDPRKAINGYSNRNLTGPLLYAATALAGKHGTSAKLLSECWFPKAIEMQSNDADFDPYLQSNLNPSHLGTVETTSKVVWISDSKPCKLIEKRKALLLVLYQLSWIPRRCETLRLRMLP